MRTSDAPPEPQEETAEVPPAARRRLGRYEVCREIGSGGMGSLVLARAKGPGGFDKLVALKLIHARFASERPFIEMFLDEARIAARIDHTNVCSVFDFGEADGVFYLAMEYLQGEPVSRILNAVAADSTQLASPRLASLVARIIADACEGLHAAHELVDEKGKQLAVVHRDISPHNLFVTFDGGVRVLDFGIAQAVGKLHQTQTGTIKGKAAYMAPEQLRGSPIDRRADIWSLGVTLWEMLTASRLFRRDAEGATIEAVTSAPVPRPSSVRASVPADIDPIVLRSLERDPERRYLTARELGRDLNRFLAAKPERQASMADLAEWMQMLFPGEAERKRQNIDRLSISGRLEGTGSGSTAEEVSRSGPRTVALKRLAVPQSVWQTASSGSATSTAITGTSSSARRAATALVVVLGLLVGVSLLLRGNDEAPPISTTAPAAVSPTKAAKAPPQEDAPPPVVARPPIGPSPSPATPKPRPRPRPRSTISELPVPRAPAGPGTVDIATPGGWADVVVAGTHRGRTPTRIELPPGRHVIDLRPFGEPPAIRAAIVVRSGASSRLVRPIESR